MLFCTNCKLVGTGQAQRLTCTVKIKCVQKIFYDPLLYKEFDHHIRMYLTIIFILMLTIILDYSMNFVTIIVFIFYYHKSIHINYLIRFHLPKM